MRLSRLPPTRQTCIRPAPTKLDCIMGRGERPTPGGQADNCADLHNFRGLDTLHPSALRSTRTAAGSGKALAADVWSGGQAPSFRDIHAG